MIRIALAAALLLTGPAFAQSTWTNVAPKDAGFTIQVPGTPRPTPQKPAHYEYTVGDSSFMVDVGPLEESVRSALTRGDTAFIATFLETLRDRSIADAHGTHRSSSKDDFRGRPSVLFHFGGTIGPKAFEAHQRIVLSPDRSFFVLAIGFTGELKQADVNRFLESFRIVAAPPMPAAPSSPQPTPPAAANAPPAAAKGMKTVSFTDAVCGYIPAIPVTFDMPADLIARKIGNNSEAGCLWGVKDDLDRVTADPSQGDFTDLRRGVFRARLSTNIVCTSQGVFDSMDGSGEAGIRAQLQGAGGNVVIWKKATLGGLPALQIVADVGGGRVYMLYLGNTNYISNVMLVNYYPPNKRSAADDELWARFVAGIRKAGS